MNMIIFLKLKINIGNNIEIFEILSIGIKKRGDIYKWFI